MENLFRFNSRRISFLIIVLVCLGLALRLVGLTKGIWLDEYSSIGLNISG